MNSSSLWLICLLGLALLNQGNANERLKELQTTTNKIRLSRPNTEAEGDDYPQDDDYDGDGDDDEDEVVGPPPVIKSTPLNLELNLGEIVILPCVVEGDQNLFSRVWRKDSVGLFVGSLRQTTNQRITNLPDGSLEIRQIEPSDSGTYTCMVSYEKVPQEVAHTLKVKSPAKIISIMPNSDLVILKQTSTLTLECTAQGHPPPNIKWFRNGHALANEDPSIQGARYTIDNASTDDAGMYKCTASNGQKVPDERTIEIQVHYPPEIKLAKEIVTTGEGYESELKCTVTGQKKPELKWYKADDRKPITSSQRIKLERDGPDHILRIIKTQQSDFGDYICEARNNEGVTSADIRLTGKPSRPMLETASRDENKNPVLVFKIESFAPIEQYELLYKREETDEWVSLKPTVTPSPDGRFYSLKHTFTDLAPGVYEAEVKAKNSYGWSEMSSIKQFPREHEGDLTETGLLAISDNSSGAAELRISIALLASLLAARYFC